MKKEVKKFRTDISLHVAQAFLEALRSYTVLMEDAEFNKRFSSLYEYVYAKWGEQFCNLDADIIDEYVVTVLQ